jgi:hypothetical protein
MADPTPQAGIQPRRTQSNLLDSLRFRWIRWVIEYSLKDQINIAKFVRFNAPKIPKAAVQPKWLILTIPAVIIAGAILWFIRRSKLSLYEKVLAALRRKGLKLDDGAQYELHLEQLEKQRPDLKPSFKAYQKKYLAWRFGGRNIDIAAITDEYIRSLT